MLFFVYSMYDVGFHLQLIDKYETQTFKISNMKDCIA